MPTLGETFRSTREAKRVKLPLVVEKTKISLDRLQALEADAYDALPDDVYTRGAIRNYAIFLDLDPRAMENLYRDKRPAIVKQAPLTRTTTTTRLAVVPIAAASLVVVVLILVALLALHVIVL